MSDYNDGYRDGKEAIEMSGFVEALCFYKEYKSEHEYYDGFHKALNEFFRKHIHGLGLDRIL